MSLVLIRHGETCGNVSKEAYLDVNEEDMVLTDVGKAQVAALAGILQSEGRRIHRVTVAPERRCGETAEMLAVSGAEIVADPRLRSQDWGTLSFPGARETLRQSKSWPSGLDVRFPDGETAREVWRRCAPLAVELRSRSAGLREPIEAVVTHGVVIKMLLAHWLGWSDDAIEGEPSVFPGSAWLARFDPATQAVSWGALVDSGADG